MKASAQSYASVSSGLTETKRFGLDGSAKVAKMLINDLAKDKVSYPVREILSNAIDASPAGVKITMPNWLDPTYRVRDYCPTSMTHEFVMNEYTTIGTSTKEDSNTQLGKWGLGSKSPYAYLRASGKSGAFNVTCYLDGTARFYLMSVDTDGSPTCSLLGTSPTDEANGTEVSWAVRKEDFDRFQMAVRNIGWGFNPRPTVIGLDSHLKWIETPTVLRSGAGWTEYKRYDVPFWGPHVRMGGVLYPIDTSKLGRAEWPWRSNSILFEAAIGSLEVTISREELAYDDRTIATLSEAVGKFEEEFFAAIQAQLDAEPTFYKALSLINGDETLKNLKDNLKDRLNWKGTALRLDAEFSVHQLGRNTFNYVTEGTIPWEQDGGRKTPSTTMTPWSVFTWEGHLPKFAFERKRGHSTLKFRAAEKAGLIQHGDQIMWLRPASDAILEEVASLFALKVTDMIDLDALRPKLSRGKREAQDPVWMKVHTIGRRGVEEGVQIDAVQGGRYLLRSENKTRGGHRRYGAWCWYIHSDSLGITDSTVWTEHLNRFPNIELPEIAFVTKDQLTRMKKYGRWTSYTGEELLAEMEKHINFSLILDATTVQGISSSTTYTLDALKEKHMKLLPDDVVDLWNKYHVMKNALSSPDNANTDRYNLYRKLGGTTNPLSVATHSSETISAYEAVKAKYPLFDAMMEITRRNHHYNDGLDGKTVRAIGTYLTNFAAQIQG